MNDVAVASTDVAEARTGRAERSVEKARRSAEDNIARLERLVAIDIKTLTAESISRHLKMLKRFQAAIDADIQRMGASAGTIRAEIDRVSDDMNEMSQLWHHNRRATSVLKRTQRRALWLSRLYPVVHFVATALALVVTIVTDRQTTIVENIANRLVLPDPHDIALLIVFGGQMFLYERIVSRLRESIFRKTYSRLLHAASDAAEANSRVGQHADTLTLAISKAAQKAASLDGSPTT